MRLGLGGELVESREVFGRNSLGCAGGGRGFQQLAQLVQLDEPVFRARADDGPLVEFQRHNAVRRQPLQSLHDGRAAEAELLGDLRALQLGASLAIPADNLQQNPLIDLVDARGSSAGGRAEIGGGLTRVDGMAKVSSL